MRCYIVASGSVLFATIKTLFSSLNFLVILKDSYIAVPLYTIFLQFRIHRNGPYYMCIVLKRANFTNELKENDHETISWSFSYHVHWFR